MRHGQLPSIPDNNQPPPKTTADAPAEQSACPFGAYSSLFDARPVPLGKSPEADSLQKMIEEIAAARSSGVDDPPAPAKDKVPDCEIEAGDENIPAGYTYFGQLVVHDLTHSFMTAMRDGATPVLQNLSTPNLDLDTIYGGGPDRCPHLYQPAQTKIPHPLARTKLPRGSNDDDKHLFLLGRTAKPAFPENWRQGHGLPFDLPRVDAGSRGIAETALRVGITPLVHDDRNDDNLILAQLTALFMLVHNTVANYLRWNGDPTDNDSEMSSRDSFELARHFVLKAYRRIVVYDFLERLLLPSVYKQLMEGKIESHGHVPVEFVFGAARVGHAMVRGSYTVNELIDPAASGLGRLMSFSGHTPDPNLPLPADWVVDWQHLLEIDEKVTPQNSRRISPFLAPIFVHGRLTTRPTGLEGSLSFHDLWRCYKLGLPTGQQYARQWFGAGDPNVLSDEKMLPTPVFADLHPADNLIAVLKKYPNFLKETPLSYYLLQEAAALGCDGRYLGPLGSYIYAATIMHALETSPPVPVGQSGLAFKDILDDTGIKTLPELLKVLDLPDAELAIVIAETLHRT
jgi:hypothetical protein